MNNFYFHTPQLGMQCSGHGLPLSPISPRPSLQVRALSIWNYWQFPERAMPFTILWLCFLYQYYPSLKENDDAKRQLVINASITLLFHFLICVHCSNQVITFSETETMSLFFFLPRTQLSAQHKCSLTICGSIIWITFYMLKTSRITIGVELEGKSMR